MEMREGKRERRKQDGRKIGREENKGGGEG